MSMRVKCGEFGVPCNWAIARVYRERVEGLIAGSLYERSLVRLRAATANLNCGCQITVSHHGKQDRCYNLGDRKYETSYTRLMSQYEPLYNAVFFSQVEMKSVILCADGDMETLYDGLYSVIMKQSDLPLMRKWMPYIFEMARLEGLISKDVGAVYEEDIPIRCPNGKSVMLSQLVGYTVSIGEKYLERIVTTGLMSGKIAIGDSKIVQPDMLLLSMDAYFELYGQSLVTNLKQSIKPLMELKGGAEEVLLCGGKRLKLQQAAVVNGVANALRYKDAVILNEGMGTGKTLQSIASVEEFFVQKYLRAHPHTTVKDAYSDPQAVTYRVIVMCPGTLVEKWKKEIEDNVPFSRATIITSLKELVTLKAHGAKRDSREFFIISKDTCKLSCAERPAPTRYTKRYPIAYACPGEGCFRQYTYKEMKKLSKGMCRCGTLVRDFKRVPLDTRDRLKGLACPSCGEVLVSPQGEALCSAHFAERTAANSVCRNCGEPLWVPNSTPLGAPRQTKWHRVSFFANAKKAERRNVWVLRGHEGEFIQTLPEYAASEVEDALELTMRKWAPSRFIKSQLKGFFDVAIFDELHVYKSGDSAQGSAMHAICSVTKKKLALTGTIAGGMANHLYYNLWRLAPQNMLAMGYKFEDEEKFISNYGTLETKFAANETYRYNVMSKGQQLNSPAVKPGISPVIFQDFIADKAVFLDLSDMSKYLPHFSENVIPCEMDPELDSAYNRTVQRIKNSAKHPRELASSLLQFSLAYVDRPYDCLPIIHPKTGEVVDIPVALSSDKLYAKERKLVDIVNSELDEGRNCFVYAEYTGKEGYRVTDRLKQLLLDYCGLEESEVAIIEASSPAAGKREEWMHKKAASGVRIFICNPRLVETGRALVSAA